MDIISIFNTLRTRPSGRRVVGDGPGMTQNRIQQVASFTQTAENVQEEREFHAQFDAAVDEVRRDWGEPVYEGPGWREGHKRPCPSPDDLFWQSYFKALRIAWWNREGFVHAVMLTGHDANTLQILELAVAEAGERSGPPGDDQ